MRCEAWGDSGEGFRFLTLMLQEPPAAEHCDHQLAVRRGRIRPGVMKRTEAGTGLADRIDDVEQVAGRAREAIEAGDDTSTSPDSSRRITLASSGLSVFAPEAFSLK